MDLVPTEVSFRPRVCRECNTTTLSGKWREHCLHCGHPFDVIPLPVAVEREAGPYDCPVCAEGPRACTCLRPSVRRRIASAIGA